jgi:hypothetical protein
LSAKFGPQMVPEKFSEAYVARVQLDLSIPQLLDGCSRIARQASAQAGSGAFQGELADRVAKCLV